MATAAHIHCLVVPSGYQARDAWMEQWVFGKLLVPADTPCSRIVWWCMSTGCPEGAWPDSGRNTAESAGSGRTTAESSPYDQDAST